MSAFSHSHYRHTMAPDELGQWAVEAAKNLPSHLGDYLPIFCYRGMSGIAYATALNIAYCAMHGPKLGMIYVRKADETCHSGMKQGELCLNQVKKPQRSMLVFVDDLIDSGRTEEITIKGARSLLLHNYYNNIADVDPIYYLRVVSGPYIYKRDRFQDEE